MAGMAGKVPWLPRPTGSVTLAEAALPVDSDDASASVGANAEATATVPSPASVASSWPAAFRTVVLRPVAARQPSRGSAFTEYELASLAIGSSVCSPGQVANGERAKSLAV